MSVLKSATVWGSVPLNQQGTVIHDFPQPPIGPRTLAGLAAWLRKAAVARNKVELSPTTARMIADVLDQQANQMMQGRVA